MSEFENSYSALMDYLVFKVGRQYFALPSTYLVTILDSPLCTPVPNAPKHVRGVINFNDASIPLYDLRAKLGEFSHREQTRQLIEDLKQRKQDHLNWVQKLKDEVSNDKLITVETNHHHCAFGRWYDAFVPESDELARYLKQFDLPHKRIHQIAIDAKKFLEEGSVDAAKNLILETENGQLKTLIRLFDGIESVINRYKDSYTIIVDYPGYDKFAIAADSLLHFDKFSEVIYPLPQIFRQESMNFIDALGRLESESATEDILIIGIENFLKDDVSSMTACLQAE